jgi:hypothetical protein
LARGSGFDYGQDFEIYCHLNFHVARQEENEVAGQVSKIPKNKFWVLVFSKFYKFY